MPGFITSVHLCKRGESITEDGGFRRLESVVQLKVTQVMFSENSLSCDITLHSWVLIPLRT